MGFEVYQFGSPIYDEQSEEPKKTIVIACEGRKTEIGYFKAISSNLIEDVSSIVKVELVDRKSNDSSPEQVVSDLKAHLDDKFDLDLDNDQLWIVIDRELEKQTERKLAIEQIQPQCEQLGIRIALSNPTIEFFILLHVADISKYDPKLLYNNEKVSKNKRFLEKELSRILAQGHNATGYSKRNFNTRIVSRENIVRMFSQQSLFATELDDILNHLGTNVSDLVAEILPRLKV